MSNIFVPCETSHSVVYTFLLSPFRIDCGAVILKQFLGEPPKQIFGKREVKGVYEIIVQQDENFKYPDVQVASHG